MYGINAKIWISTVALFFAGLTSALSLLPVIPEIFRETKTDENISIHLDRQAYRDILNDHVSGMFNCSFALGNTLGPLIGNFLYVFYGCSVTCDLIAAYILIFIAAYLVATGCIKEKLINSKNTLLNETYIGRVNLSRISLEYK